MNLNCFFFLLFSSWMIYYKVCIESVIDIAARLIAIFVQFAIVK